MTVTVWALLMPGGRVVTGGGEGPTENVSTLAREATASMFASPGRPPIFVAGGVEILVTTEAALGGTARRHWSWRAANPLARLWALDGGAVLGLGPTYESVRWAVSALEAAGGRRA